MVLPSTFKWVLVTVIGLTVGAVIAQLATSIMLPTTTVNEQSVFEGLGFIWKTGFGALCGLLGGKIIR